MRPNQVPAFDLLPPTLRQRFDWRPHFKSLALAFACGAAIAGIALAEGRRRLERAWLDQAQQQAQVDRLGQELAALDKQLQQRLGERAQWLEHQQQQVGWIVAAETLRAVAHPLGSSPTSQLLELRIDEQGLQLVGQIAPQQMQPWLERVRQRCDAWGAPELLEIAPPLRAPSAAAEEAQLLRFVARLQRPASQTVGRQP